MPQRRLRLIFFRRPVRPEGEGAWGSLALVVVWSGPRCVRHFSRLANAVMLMANRFLDELVIPDRELCRCEQAVATHGVYR